METIGSFWWLWLVLFLASFSCAMVFVFKSGMKITFGLLDLILMVISGGSNRNKRGSRQMGERKVDNPDASTVSDEGDVPSELAGESSGEKDAKSGSLIGRLVIFVVTGLVALVTSLLFTLSIIVNLIRLAIGH